MQKSNQEEKSSKEKNNIENNPLLSLEKYRFLENTSYNPFGSNDNAKDKENNEKENTEKKIEVNKENDNEKNENENNLTNSYENKNPDIIDINTPSNRSEIENEDEDWNSSKERNKEKLKKDLSIKNKDKENKNNNDSGSWGEDSPIKENKNNNNDNWGEDSPIKEKNNNNNNEWGNENNNSNEWGNENNDNKNNNENNKNNVEKNKNNEKVSDWGSDNNDNNNNEQKNKEEDKDNNKMDIENDNEEIREDIGPLPNPKETQDTFDNIKEKDKKDNEMTWFNRDGRNEKDEYAENRLKKIMLDHEKSMKRKEDKISELESLEFEMYYVKVSGNEEPKLLHDTKRPRLRFENLNKVPEQLKKNINTLKFDYLTPIQRAIMPYIQVGKDIVCIAETGSGKTLSYLFPIIGQMLIEGVPENPFISKKEKEQDNNNTNNENKNEENKNENENKNEENNNDENNNDENKNKKYTNQES